MKVLKTLSLAMAGAAAFVGTSAGAAVIAPTITGASGSFDNPSVTCGTGVTAPCNFTDTVTFATPTGYNTVSAIINSTFNPSSPETQLNFSSVVLNNSVQNFAFNITNGVFDQASREMIPLISGATNILTISGQTFGNASYGGSLAFGTTAAVPEPGTWALMLLGFGAIGFSMRRRRSQTAHLYQAA